MEYLEDLLITADLQIKTTKNDSKFGVSIFDPKTLELISKIDKHPNMDFMEIGRASCRERV
jgi:penicillin-binding protein-related factor A (putative recombinase)